jgi:NTP pyrophosphatase (non-canonical NTP hydrolase)
MMNNQICKQTQPEISVQDIEAMLILQEECAEVTQAVSKVFRFGFDECYPVGGPDNRAKLEEELGDLLAMIDIMVERCVISDSNLNAARKAKVEKLKKWSRIYDK